MSDHEEETINEENAHPKVVPQITTVTNISAKFPYLKKEDAKSMTTDKDGNLKIRPPVTAEEHQQVQREEKARTILLSALPDEYMEEGLDKGYDKMQKILSQMNNLKIKPEPEDVNMKFLRGLPPSCSGIALILITKEGLEYISFDDLYNKLKFLKIDTKGYSSNSSTLSNAAFINQHLVYEDLDQINKEDFEEYDLKHQMAMLSIKVHRFKKKHGRKIKFNGRENARFDKKLKYKSKEAGKDGSDSKVMVVVNGSIDWDKQTEGGNIEPRSLENFGMIAGIKIESNADSKGEVVSAADDIPAGIFIPAGTVAAAVIKCHQTNRLAYEEKIRVLSYELEEKSKILEYRQKLIDQATQEKQELMTNLDNEIANQAKWNNSGNYMPPSNIPDIDESHMVYGKKATDSSKIKTTDDSITYTNDSVLFDFSDRSSEPSTNDIKMYDSSVECSRPNHGDRDSTDSISSVSAPKSGDTIVIDYDKQEDFRSVCSIETDVKSSKPLCNKFGSFNKESYFRKHKFVASKSCYVCGSYLHLIKDYDLHEQRFAKRNAEGKSILGRRSTGKPINPNRPKPVSAGQPNLVFAGQPNTVSVCDGILGPRPLNIQPKSTYFHSFTHNNQQIIFLITHNLLYSLYMTGRLNGKTAVKPSAEKLKDRCIIDSGCSRSMSGNKDKLEDFENFDGGEVTFGGSTGKISGKATVKTKNLNFENVLYVEEL
uniref:Ribonuclease H-like domain-containing protein n=1 Tax=Tanacetum cinerariifolium TaxID=118510 RepID=A0A699HLH6_TANCI|nr:ribonuclease H-like domain-containing protein [Tanacetum cinerariifolium]